MPVQRDRDHAKPRRLPRATLVCRLSLVEGCSHMLLVFVLLLLLLLLFLFLLSLLLLLLLFLRYVCG